MTTTTHTIASRLPRSRHSRRWLVVLGTRASATALSGIEVALGIDLVVRQGDRTQHIDSLAVTLTSLVVGFLAWGSLTLAERLSAKGRTAWRVLAAVVLLLSLTGPLAAVSLSAGLGLLALHLVVGGLLLLVLPSVGGSVRPR
jgi:hypothetical protein